MIKTIKYIKTIESICCIFVIAICFAEISIGIFQLLGLIRSNHSLFLSTGTFPNPGPYGGFLAICICVLYAYYIYGEVKWIKRFSVIVIIPASVIIIITQSRAALVAVFMCFLAFSCKKTQYLQYIIKNKYFLVALSFILFLMLYLAKKPSADGRIFIDHICMRAIYHNKFKGLGIGSFAGTYGKEQSLYFEEIMKTSNKELDWTVINENERMIADSPDKAFNDYLQIALEQGFVFMLAFMFANIYLIVISYKNNYICCYGLIAFSFFAMFSYPVRITLLFSLYFSIITCIVLCHSLKKKRILFVDSVCLIIITFLFAERIMLTIESKANQLELNKIIRAYDAEDYIHVSDLCDSYMQKLGKDPNFLYMYGYSLRKINQIEKSDSVLSLGTNYSSNPMFWNVMGNNSLTQGRYREAEERYKHAFYMVPNRLYPLYLLAKLYYTEGDTVRFLQMAEMVEEFIPKVESVNTESLRTEIRELKSTLIMTNKCDQ